MPGLDSLQLSLGTIIPSMLRIVAIIVAAGIVRAVAARIVTRAVEVRIPQFRREEEVQLAQRSKTVSGAMQQALSLFIWTVALLMILSETGMDIGPILATVGLGALAIGLAAQNIIRDYIHGFFILIEDWYRVGEVAAIGATSGVVESVSLRRTVLRDLHGTLHILPNIKIDSVSNMTRDWSRVNMNVSVAYKEDLAHVFSVINEVGEEMRNDAVWGKDLLTTPQAERVDNLGSSGIEIKVLATTKPIRQWALAGELRRRLKERFDAEGIEIPWPHTKLYFGNAPGTVAAPGAPTDQ